MIFHESYCSVDCTEQHQLPDRKDRALDLGNYEETPASILICSHDGEVCGEVLRVQELRKQGKERNAA